MEKKKLEGDDLERISTSSSIDGGQQPIRVVDFSRSKHDAEDGPTADTALAEPIPLVSTVIAMVHYQCCTVLEITQQSFSRGAQ